MAIHILSGADLHNQKITNLGEPTDLTDAVNLSVVNEALIQSHIALSWKIPVRAATDTARDLATEFIPPVVIDGVQFSDGGHRILIKDQVNASENGIYILQTGEAPIRDADANTTIGLEGATVYVLDGLTNANTAWSQTLLIGELGVDPIEFAQFGGGGGGELPIAGSGLTLTGSTLDVGQGTGISVGADAVGIDTAVVVRKFAQEIGDGTTNPIVVTHNLGTVDVDVVLTRNSDRAKVLTDWITTDLNTLSVTFPSAPTANQYRIVVQG
ncbi:MAG: hypothetical protein IJI97_01375 [Clostridia bacterium]|nr:hypothetical protein [Clostridia bacterium]